MVTFDFLENDSEKIEYINSLGNLIKGDEISPESLNEALANYFPITRYLLTLYESVSLEDDMLKLDYKTWYADKFIESKTKLNADVTVKSKMASTTEIEQNLIVTNKSDYIEWQQKLIISEKRKSFYFRITESWKSNSQQIIQLSQNMRTELYSLRTQDKANEDITKEKLIRHIDESEYGEIETNTVKKVKKIMR
jgi:hypothetical protein